MQDYMDGHFGLWEYPSKLPPSREAKMFQRCEDTNLCLNWEKSHFMVKEGIVLGHKISKKGIEAKKLLIFSKLAIVDPPGDITVPTTPPKSVKEKFRNVMKCLKIPSKFAKSLTCGASISWGRSRLHEGTNTYSLRTTMLVNNGFEAKALPTNDARVVCNDARVVCKFLKSLFARFGTPRAIISDLGTHFCNDQFAKVMLKYGVTHRLATAYHP
ncbi:reverse transcriptase domain-containing protein [Tanacetum coccineum]